MFDSDILSKGFLTIGSYFPDGGETYTIDELLFKIENDLGYDRNEAKALIDESVKANFMIDCGDGAFTR
ncbi:MAG: hypothetical protein HDT43_09260 [Ruminococcaceae bacterium]|nr:hypothetical protein [Oscillospiraceae bacterium]